MRRIFRSIAIALALLLLVLLSLPFLVNINRFRPMLEYSLTTALGREVKVGHLKLSILSGGVGADDLSVADDPSFSRTSFLRAKSLKITVELAPLIFSKKLNVTGITIDEPEIVLLQSDSGAWNFSSLGANVPAAAPAASPEPPGKARLDLSVKLVKITGGRLSMGNDNSNSKPLVIEKTNVELRDFARTSVFPFSLSAMVAGGGAIKLKGKAGPIHPTDTAQTPVQAGLTVTQLDLAGSGLVDASTGVAGLVSVDGSGASNGKTLQVRGRVKAERMKLAKDGSPARRPIAFDFAVGHDLQKRSGVLSRGDIRIGAAAASLTGTYIQRGESTVLKMNLAGSSMPVPDLVEMLPALGVVLPAGSSLQGGTASARLALAGPTNQTVTSGAVGLSNTRLAGFDLGSKLSTIVKLAGLPVARDTDIQTFSADIRISPDGTRAENFKLIAPAIGELNGAGTVSVEHALDFKMRATLHTSGGVMAVIGQKGDTSVPFFIVGTSSNPIFRPDVRSITSDQIKSLKESGLGKRASGLLDGIFGRRRRK
jgi:AsmA protein